MVEPAIKYISCKTINKTFEVCASTLRYWADQGKLHAIHLDAHSGVPGKRLYAACDVKHIIQPTAGQVEEGLLVPKHSYIYAHVSSQHQKEDLQRHISALQQRYPNHKLLSDIGSGLNWK